ncbi:MAG: serine/threonine protein kinase [Bdellovibrionaceae bacterium]|nr:serine/threonine protein kinase [Pseudobdellovibrionaceae bacterium]|tara:strand:- start:7035 stop:7796 length:762 start_codon:yes stop_codon:yes gene_type:complete
MDYEERILSFKNSRFEIEKGIVLQDRYMVEKMLGGGFEGEVYQCREMYTGHMVAAKIFYPERNKQFKKSIIYAKKLIKLSSTPIIMDYISHETMWLDGVKHACIFSEYIEGILLSEFLDDQKGKRLDSFLALHLLHAIVRGVEQIHRNGEYHGDLHLDNIIIQRVGLEFKLKIIDLHHWGDSKKDNRDEDIIKIIRIFYDLLGGPKHYQKLPPAIKEVICGLKRGLILKKFRTITQLRNHLELMEWTDGILYF